MHIDKKALDMWVFRGDETACKYCVYSDECPKGVRRYGDVPIYPYCEENNDTDNIDYDGVLYDLKENFKELFMELNINIEKVIFNPPATIVFWSNGDKTVVKCDKDDKFDKEKGLAMAISKYFFGNKSNFNNEFKKFIKEENLNVTNKNGLIRVEKRFIRIEEEK